MGSPPQNSPPDCFAPLLRSKARGAEPTPVFNGGFTPMLCHRPWQYDSKATRRSVKAPKRVCVKRRVFGSPRLRHKNFAVCGLRRGLCPSTSPPFEKGGRKLLTFCYRKTVYRQAEFSVFLIYETFIQENVRPSRTHIFQYENELN